MGFSLIMYWFTFVFSVIKTFWVWVWVWVWNVSQEISLKALWQRSEHILGIYFPFEHLIKHENNIFLHSCVLFNHTLLKCFHCKIRCPRLIADHHCRILSHRHQHWSISIGLMWCLLMSPGSVPTTVMAAPEFVVVYLKGYPDSKVYGANMGPIWGRQDPGGPHVGSMNLVICPWAHQQISYDTINDGPSSGTCVPTCVGGCDDQD